MAMIYARWIKAGRIALAEVPAKWRDAVRALLPDCGRELPIET